MTDIHTTPRRLLLPSKIVFAKRDEAFAGALRARVDQYFLDTGTSKFAGSAMWTKTLVIVSAFAGSYTVVLSNVLHGWAQLVAIVIMHFAMFQLTIGIAHDAAHRAYVRSARGNRLITYLFEFVGIDSQYWIDMHVHKHHSGPNIPLRDTAIESFALLRLHPKTKRTWLHRHQHRYVFVIYSLVTVFQVFLLELFALKADSEGFYRDRRSPWTVAKVALGKLWVLGYSVVVPVLVVEAPAWWTLLACLCGHIVCGISIGIFFQTTHLARDTTFPEPDAHGRLRHSYVRHVLETTADVAPRSLIVTWLSGGLNIHVAHHLFPRISQVHLPAVARIVKETARQFGMPYREFGLFAGIVSHLDAIRRLGHAPSQDRQTE